MKACRLIRHGRPGQYDFVPVPDPSPGPGEALISVRACGLNRLDLWTEEGGLPVPIQLPRIPGCEPSGQVFSVGAGVSKWTAGDRVAVQSNLFCGECEFCRAGEETVCLSGRLLGVQLDGGFAGKVLVPAGALVRIPENVSFEAAASLTLAAATAMHMLTNRVSVPPGSTVLVVGGTSGVGSAAIQIARSLGARVFALSSTAAKRELSMELGAEAAFDSSTDDWPKQVRHATARRGVDFVVEHVGGEILPKCFECLGRNGTVITCGATAGRDVAVNLWPLFVKQHRLVGSYGRTRLDMERTLQWASEGRIRPVIDSCGPMDELPQAIAKLRSGLVMGKLVLRPGQDW